MKNKVKYIPIIVLIISYFTTLLFALKLYIDENNIAYIIIGITAPLPLLIGIIIALIKLIKMDE